MIEDADISLISLTAPLQKKLGPFFDELKVTMIVENKYNHPDYKIKPWYGSRKNTFADSINKAKKELSQDLDVLEENIEIIIKG